MKKDKFVNKFVKRDFNNELESILESKEFDENVKSTLLSMLYKIESAYKDIEIVKQDVDSKEEYIQKFLNTIENQCNSIKMVKMNETNTKIPKKGTYFIDKENRNIECYPIERKMLYAIWKMARRECIIKDKYYLINSTLSSLLNVGNTIEKVEVFRDFNGYSWTTVNTEIDSIEHNLIYQNLRMLVGSKFLEEWIEKPEILIDYYAKFKEKLEENYDKKLAKQLIETIEKISIMLAMKYEKGMIQNYQNEKEEIQIELNNMQNSQNYVKLLTNQKVEYERKIKEIDTMINNKDVLHEEYIKRNESLPLEKKIFSMKVLANILNSEREEYVKKIEEKNKIMNPKKFVEYKKEIQNKAKYFDILNIQENELKTQLNKEILQFQKLFLKAINIKIDKIETKQQAISMLYQVRYYMQLPITSESKIIDKLAKTDKGQIIDNLMKKSIEFKAISSKKENNEIIFFSREINLK